MNFQFSSIPKAHFEFLFSLPDDLLTHHGARRLTATSDPGFPCRVSLEDTPVGEEVLLVNYEHLGVDTPFRSRHAVYVRPMAKQAQPLVNEVPEMLRSRTLSLRAWTEQGMLAGADLADGTLIEPAIANLLSLPETSFIHVHFAKAGCFAARVDRA